MPKKTKKSLFCVSPVLEHVDTVDSCAHLMVAVATNLLEVSRAEFKTLQVVVSPYHQRRMKTIQDF